jgi:hypothetical protein
MLLDPSSNIFSKAYVTALFRILQNINPKVSVLGGIWLRGLDLNQRPSGYEPDELPGCSTPRFEVSIYAPSGHEIKSQNDVSEFF